MFSWIFMSLAAECQCYLSISVPSKYRVYVRFIAIVYLMSLHRNFYNSLDKKINTHFFMRIVIYLQRNSHLYVMVERECSV